MRKLQKFGAAMIVAVVMAAGMSTFGTTVSASGGTDAAAQKTAVCAAIETTEAQLAASTNPLVKKYLAALLAGLERLEALLGGCAS